MSMMKKIEIDGKAVAFKASAAIPRIYRIKFQRDIYKDLSVLEKSIGDGDPEKSSLDLFSLGMICLWRAETMSIRDGDRLPHRRIFTGSNLMKCDDRISEKRYNDFMKSEAGGNIHENCDY